MNGNDLGINNNENNNNDHNNSNSSSRRSLECKNDTSYRRFISSVIWKWSTIENKAASN